MPELDAILTDIESEPATIEHPEELVEEDRRIEQALRGGRRAIDEIMDVHEVKVGRAENISPSPAIAPCRTT